MKSFEELKIQNKYEDVLKKVLDDYAWKKKPITPESIIEEMMIVICLLQVKKDGDEWIYDLSDLEGIKEVV